jgi:hypothetical protein
MAACMYSHSVQTCAACPSPPPPRLPTPYLGGGGPTEFLDT